MHTLIMASNTQVAVLAAKRKTFQCTCIALFPLGMVNVWVWKTLRAPPFSCVAVTPCLHATVDIQQRRATQDLNTRLPVQIKLIPINLGWQTTSLSDDESSNGPVNEIEPRNRLLSSTISPTVPQTQKWCNRRLPSRQPMRRWHKLTAAAAAATARD